MQCAGNSWGSREGLGEANSEMEPCPSNLSVWTSGIERSTSQQLSGLSFHDTYQPRENLSDSSHKRLKIADYFTHYAVLGIEHCIDYSKQPTIVRIERFPGPE